MHIAVFQPDACFDMAALLFFDDAVVDRIFNDRLQQKNRHHDLICVYAVCFDGISKPVPKPHLLQVHIVIGNRKLLREGNKLFHRMQIIPENTGKRADHLVRRLRVLNLRHAGNRIQCVEEKVRINLRLQEVEADRFELFCHDRAVEFFLMKLLREALVFLQGFDVVPCRVFHLVEGGDQLAQLVRVVDPNVGLVEAALYDFADRLRKNRDRCYHGAGEDARKTYDEQQHQHGKQNQNIRKRMQRRIDRLVGGTACFDGYFQEIDKVPVQVTLHVIKIIQVTDGPGLLHVRPDQAVPDFSIRIVGVPDIPGSRAALGADFIVVIRQKLNRVFRVQDSIAQCRAGLIGLIMNICPEGTFFLLHRLLRGFATRQCSQNLLCRVSRIVHRIYVECSRGCKRNQKRADEELNLFADGHRQP